MKAILGMLALLAVASTASATFAPWYYQTLYKNKCYVPGCDQCVAYKPYTCEKCAAGYALLKHNTCGCAAGFGSYVQPPTAGYPYYPPHSCPSWTLSKAGSAQTTGVRSTLASGRAGASVSLKTWYSTKPDFCTQTYLPTKTCQGSIPVSSVGYCKCFACPAGTNSTGGPIASAGAACTAGAQPVVRCTQTPPAIANANPWNPKCKLLRTSKACTTTCAAGFQPSPAGSALTARCTLGGVWQVTGSCVSASAVCKGSPSAPANANAFADCTDGAAGATCKSTCAAGFEGTVSATCNAASGKWDVSATCEAAAVTCSGTPSAANADFTGCSDLKAGATCTGVCTADASDITATCGNDGKYTLSGTCPAGVTCPGSPEAGDNADAFAENQKGELCADGALGDACKAECLPGFDGSAEAICEAGGWSVTNSCSESSGGGGGDVTTCDGTPQDATNQNANKWPESCAGVAIDDICEGTCAAGFNADGSYANAYCTPGGVWELDVACVME